jgi:hypothetical protein
LWGSICHHVEREASRLHHIFAHRSRQRERERRQTRDREIRALLEAALRKLEEGSP